MQWASMSVVDLPVPPETLRVWVAPFSDADLFVRSGEEMVTQIKALCGLPPNAQVLEIGCGCGRLSRAFARYLNSEGRYEGFDVAPVLIKWCQQQLEPRLSNFRFLSTDVRAGGHNPGGAVSGAAFRFPYHDSSFDLAVVSSVFTHMLPDEIENYVAQIFRVLKPNGCCFISIFLFDSEAEMAVASGSTIFDFRYPLGPCLTFDSEHPAEGVACRKQWFLGLIERNGFHLEVVQLGNWRAIRSHQISQDYVVVRKRVPGPK
ncbi:MAG: class I SAM-dependent methyltransferase [Xanthobacteraceae bacterium]